jgi:hypothetical protein
MANITAGIICFRTCRSVGMNCNIVYATVVLDWWDEESILMLGFLPTTVTRFKLARPRDVWEIVPRIPLLI